MSYRFACDNVVPGCEGVVEADTVDELLGMVADHADRAHGINQIDDAVAAQVEAGIERVER